MTRMRNSKWKLWLALTGGLFAVVHYVMAYAVLVEPYPPKSVAGVFRQAYYPIQVGNAEIGIEILHRIFAPAHLIDRKIRPEFWK